VAEDPVCEVEVIDFTDSIEAELKAELADLCCFGLLRDSGSANWSVSLVLTSDEHLTRLHDEFMGVAEPTDIMTFPDDDQPGGDIVISVDQAERQRHEDGWPLAQEVRFLVLHGVLHLTGWDDPASESRGAMLERQRVLLAEFQDDRLRSR
jgi:rRNA maturation RNase YbeY